MAVKVRSAPSAVAAGVNIDPAANTAGEQIITGQVMDWAMKGYVYSAGILVDDSDISVVTTLDDLTPTVALQSPVGGDYIVLPLRVNCNVTAITGGLTTLDLVFTKAAAECATTLTLTGSAMPGTHNHYTPNPTSIRKSTCIYTVSASALTNVDTAILAHGNLVADGLAAASMMQLSHVFDYSFEDSPIALTDGAALLLYGYSASTANTIRVSFTWVEIPRNVYEP